MGQRRLLVAVGVLMALVGARGGWSTLNDGSSQSAAQPALKTMPVPGGERGEELNRLDQYWNSRLTYPTGKYNPAWLRKAVRQDKRIKRAVPAGRTRKFFGAATAASAETLSTSGFTSLGPAPEKMTGCGGCFDYTTTSGRINAIAIDPTTTTNGSITAYAASVGGGVWKTTTCCSATTTWSLSTSDLMPSLAIDTLAIDP